MIARNGILTTLRARGRAALFAALILVLTLSLSLGMGMWAYCAQNLAAMEESYTSVALVEYLGSDYPDGNAADAYARQAGERLDGAAVAALDGVELWQENDRTLAVLEGYDRRRGDIPYENRGVFTVFNLVPVYETGVGTMTEVQLGQNFVAVNYEDMTCRIRVNGLENGDFTVPLYYYDDQRGEYYLVDRETEKLVYCGAPEEDRFAFQYGEKKVVFRDQSLGTQVFLNDNYRGMKVHFYEYLPEWDVYLSYEQYIVRYDGIISESLYTYEGKAEIAVSIEVGESGFVAERGKKYVVHGQFLDDGRANRTLALTDFYEGCGTKPYALVSGSDDPLLSDSLFTQYADFYRAANNYISVEAGDNIPALEAFQQGYVTLSQGRFPQAGETGVCVIDGQTAAQMGLSLGDSLSLTLMTSGEEDRFDLTVTDDVRALTVVGVTQPAEGYEGTVWVSGGEGGFEAPLFGYQLGTAVLDNKKARAAADAIQDMAPAGVRVTLYDQGYSAAAQPLETMRTTAMAVTIASACGALAVLLLFAYLFVGRQRETVSVLFSLGTPAGKIRLWLLSGASLIVGAAALLGAVVSALALGRMIRAALSLAQGLYAADRRYSQAAIGVVREAAGLDQIPVWPAAAAGCGVLAAGLVLCLVFLRQARRQSAPRRGRLSVRVPRGGTSVRGRGALRFAASSARRGGWRSAVVPAAALVLSLFLGILAGIAQGWDGQVDDLYENAVLTGQVVSINGRQNTNLVVPADSVRTLWKSGLLSDVGASLGWSYWFWDEMPKFANTSFGEERRADWIASQPKLVALNSLSAAPGYMNSAPPQVTWLDGWDESFLANDRYGFCLNITPYFNSYSAEGADTVYPCVVGEELLARRGLSLGDEMETAVSITYALQKVRVAIRLQVVGTVNQAGGEQEIYVPLSFWCDPAWITGAEDVLQLGERPIMNLKSPEEMEKYRYATTNFGTCTFTLNSAYDLEDFRDYLAGENFSQVGKATANRTTVLLRDQSFTETVEGLGRYLAFSRILFPVLFLTVGLLGFIISWLMINGRRMEFAIMRGLGASRGRVFLSFFLEQAGLCLAGCALGCLGLLLLPGGGAARWLAAAGFLLCYLAGCALSVLAVGRTHLMSLLSERE